MTKQPNMVKLLDHFKDRISIRYFTDRSGIQQSAPYYRRKERKDFSEDQRRRLTDALYKLLWLPLGQQLGFLDRYKAEIEAATEKRLVRRAEAVMAASKLKTSQTVSKNNQEHERTET